jgi:hypothetical protein
VSVFIYALVSTFSFLLLCSALLLDLRGAYIKLKSELKEVKAAVRISCLTGVKKESN